MCIFFIYLYALSPLSFINLARVLSALGDTSRARLTCLLSENRLFDELRTTWAEENLKEMNKTMNVFLNFFK
jgi:hypothetical protein